MNQSLTAQNGHMPFLFQGNRKEITDVKLNVIQGSLPSDLHGYVYLMSQCGTVNSGGYPFPKTIDGKRNGEYGSPVLNGNGMVFLFDLSSSGQVSVSSRITRSASYYADNALREGGPAREDKDFKNWEFKNMGISRMSMFLGPVNYANTAVIPVNFKNDSGVSILATYDTGRPLKLDPLSLEMITPIGYNKEWDSSFPRFMQAPLPMFENTAHPTWDPVEKVLYSVNFTKSAETEMSRTFLYELMRRDKVLLFKEIFEIAKDYKEHKSTEKDIDVIKEKAIDQINKLMEEKRSVKTKKKKKRWWQKILQFLFGWIQKITETKDSVHLIRFDGEGELKRWQLRDESGKPLRIYQCMHQTSVTKDHVVLMDSSFKFAFDLLINNPFPHEPIIDELIRDLSAKTILPSTQVWIVKKSDLVEGKESAIAYAVKGQPIDGLSNEPDGGIPMECVHFTAEYDEPNGQISFYTAHNNSTCLAEWIREYDINYFTQQPYDDSDISNYSVGQLSLSSVGKYVVDTRTKSFVPGANAVLREKGNLPPVSELEGGPLKNVGPNTWGIGLYGCRDMISPTKTQSKIDNLFFVSFGTQPSLLTQFVHNLYAKEDQNRVMPLEEVLAYTKCGIPQSLISIETAGMTIEDHFEFEWGVFPMSVQFIPLPSPTPERPSGKDGYIWIVGKALVQKNGAYTYQSQVLIFEAWNVSQGPVCTLAADDFNPCTCLHITWLEVVDTLQSGYLVNPITDYNDSIQKSFMDPLEHKKYQKFFDTYVYPNFKGNNSA